MGRVPGPFFALVMGAALLHAAPTFALGPGVTIAIADMNGDGIPDLVTLQPDSSTVDVVTVDAQSNFTLLPPQRFLDISQMSSIAIADVNGDGIPDLIISDGSGSTAGVRVLLNDGHGNLSADVSYPSEASSGLGPVAVVAADVNGDGKIDLITANGTDGTVSVLFGNGDGTFAAPVSYAAGADPVAVAVADINGDGFPDLVMADSSGGSVQVLLNDGDGTFAPPVGITVGTNPVAVTLADVDGDGKPDLVVADQGDDKAAILIGQGDGSFATPVFYTTGAQPGWVTAQDLNGDGKPDLVTDNYSDGSVSVFTNTGDGGFAPSQLVYPAYGSYDTVVMDIGGAPKLVSANVPAGTVVVTPAPTPVQTSGGDSGSSAPTGTTHPIKGAQDPQSSNGGAVSLLSLVLFGMLALSRRFAR